GDSGERHSWRRTGSLDSLRSLGMTTGDSLARDDNRGVAPVVFDRYCLVLFQEGAGLVAELVFAQAGRAQILFEVETRGAVEHGAGELAQKRAPDIAVVQVPLEHHHVEGASGQEAAVGIALHGVADAQRDTLQ